MGASLCPACGTQTEESGRFCASCGAPLLASCRNCGAEVRITARFCAVCGSRVDQSAPLGEERKLVTVLFADLTGSTTLGEQLDPEQLRVLLADYFGAMTDVISQSGGTVEKFIGDAVVAVFGIPVSHEDDAHRALGAALDMLARVDELNPSIEERHGVRLALRIGVNTGDVIAGGGRDLAVTGDVTNVAARLQQSAEPGEIIVGERSYRAVPGSFRFEALPDRALKGKEAAVPCWRLVARAAVPRPRGLGGLAHRLVGRDHELELLSALYRATVDEKRPRVVTVLGHAGVGKTRLSEEFLTNITSGPDVAAVYRGRCLPYGTGIAYWALREILWDAGGISLEDPAPVAAEKLSKLVRDLLEQEGAADEETDRMIFALAATAGIGIPRSRFDRLNPESIGEELGLAWPRFLTALAGGGRIVFVFEDLHWAEPPLLDMIEHLVTRATGPAFILATARPELASMRPGWSARPNVSQLGLEPLANQQARDLVEEILPRTEAPLRERVIVAAEGNPFFAEEIVRHLVDQGVLRYEAGELVQVETAADVALPDTVRALLATRIDSLPSDERRVLQGASVVGRVFWADTLHAILPDESVPHALRALEEKGLVVTHPISSAPGMSELAFHHGLMREAAYQSIPRSVRAAMHAATASWTEQFAGERRLEFVDLIAHHLEAASRPEEASLAWPTDAPRREELRARAVAALLEAGDAARRRFAIDQAIGYSDRSLALAVTDMERILALELKALAASATVRPEIAWPAFLQAIALTREDDVETRSRLRAHATLLCARYGGAFRDTDWKKEVAEMITEGLRETGEDATSFEIGALLVGRASARYWQLFSVEQSAALRDAERSIEIAEAIGHPFLLSYAVDALSSVADQEGYCRAGETAELALRAARSIEDRFQSVELLVTAAVEFCHAGRFDEAAIADEAVRHATSLGPHQRVHAIGTQANRLALAGRLAELADVTDRFADVVAEDGGFTCGWGAMALGAQALALLERGDRAEAHKSLGLLDRAFREASHTASPYVALEFSAPVLGWEEVRRRISQGGEEDSATIRIAKLRSLIPAAAVSRDATSLESLVREARELAERACVPVLGWLADWAEALSAAADARDGGVVNRLVAAAGAIDGFGERYKSARLLLDALPFLEARAARNIAADLVGRFSSMAARASADAAAAFV